MDMTTLFLAKVFGLYFTIFSLFALFRHDAFIARIESVVGDLGDRTILAIVTLIIGILLVVSHNVWLANWTVLITLFCWLIFIKGILRLFCLESDKKMTEWFKKPVTLYVTMIIMLLFGLFFLWKGFFV